MVIPVANSESADEDAPLSPAQHCVPHGRRVVAALDPQPWPRGRVDLGGDPRLDQLPARGDLTGVRVDEEDSHDV